MAHGRDDADDDARADARDADAYPGVPGATKAEVDDFLRALDDFQPVVRADAKRRRRGARARSGTRDTNGVDARLTLFRERTRGFQIPDELTNLYLKRAGAATPDARVTRLVSLAAERFVRQIADDAYRCAVQRNQAQAREKKERGYDPRDKRLVLETEDLAAALKDYGVNLHKPPYYVGAVADEADDDDAADAGGKRAKR